MIGRLSLQIQFSNVLLSNLDFITFRRSANDNLIRSFLLQLKSENGIYDLFWYYEKYIKNNSRTFIEELVSKTNYTNGNTKSTNLFETYKFDEKALQEEFSLNYDANIDEETIYFEGNYNQYKLIELTLNQFFPTFSEFKAYNLSFDLFSETTPVYHPLAITPKIDMNYFEIEEDYFNKYHKGCDISQIVYTPENFPIIKSILEKYATFHLDSHDCRNNSWENQKPKSEESSLINDFKKYIMNETTNNEIKNKIISFTLDKSFKKTNKLILIEGDPIIKFKNLPILLSETLYSVHEKSQDQKRKYLYLRSLSMILFNHLIQHGYTYNDAAFNVIDYLNEELNNFDEIDYFHEFLFYPKIQPFQQKIMNYWIISFADPDRYIELKNLPTSTKLSMIEEKVNLNGIDLGRKRFINLSKEKIRIKQNNFIFEISIKQLYNKFRSDEDFEILQLGKRKIVGEYDKTLGNFKIRNSLSNFFPFLQCEISLINTDKGENDKDSSEVKIINNSFSLNFDEVSNKVFLSIYQLMNSVLPFGLKASQNITQLIQESNSVNLYNNSVVINFNSKMPGSYPRLKDIYESRSVTITSLPPKYHYTFYKNLEGLDSNLQNLFILPNYRLNYFGLQLKLNSAKNLFDYYNNQLGGDQHFINVTQLNREIRESEKYITLLVKRAGAKDTYAYIQIHFKKDFINKYFENISSELNKLDYFMKQRGIAHFGKEIERLDISDELKKSILNELKSLFKNL